MGQESLDNNHNQAFYYVCDTEDIFFPGFP